MMSRLEKIKQHQYDGYTIWDMGEDNLVWLIEQAKQNKHNQQALINQEKSSDREIERLRKRVQELEGIIYKDERQAMLESMYEENKRYREVIKKAIDDLENECLWDALVALKVLEGE